MIETQKGLLLVGIVFCLFLAVNCTSASNYYVNKDTTHKNITDWMKDDAKKGDNLIFNTYSYDLLDTLVISKSVNVKSYKNTKINFNMSKNMFNVTTNSVNFSGLTLIHNPNEIINYSDYDYSYAISSIYTSKSVEKVNFKNINISADANIKRVYVPQEPYYNGSYADLYYGILDYSGISINKWKGNLNNCNMEINKGNGINAKKWTGNLTNCNIKTINGSGVYTNGWAGNIINSNFESKGEDAYSCVGIWGTFNGDIKNSKFSVQGEGVRNVFIQWRWNGNLINSIVKAKGSFSSGLTTRLWTGTISKSKISSNGKYTYSLYNWGWWKINIKHSKFSSYGTGSTTIHSDGGACKISKTKIYGYGSASKDYPKIIPTAISLFESKGTITQSTIKQKNGYAIKASDNVNVTNCKITSKKGLKKIFRLKPDLKLINVSKSKNIYTITVDNIGDLSSKACYLSFKTKNVHKIAKIRKIIYEPDPSGMTPAEIKITIPKKYANSHYTKTIKLDIYNQNKEYSKKNNFYNLKF